MHMYRTIGWLRGPGLHLMKYMTTMAMHQGSQWQHKKQNIHITNPECVKLPLKLDEREWQKMT